MRVLIAFDKFKDVILLGVGGSATNDLGLGALAALGFKFLEAAGTAIAAPTPATWERISRIDCSGAVRLPPVFIACDVTNPLLGPHGATATFGPQKGLKAGDLPRLEAQAARMAAMLCDACGQPHSLANPPGAGAAGGIAFGLMVAGGAKLIPGFALVPDCFPSASGVKSDLQRSGQSNLIGYSGPALRVTGTGPGCRWHQSMSL